MPRKLQAGRQVKVWLGEPLYAALRAEARETGRPMAEVVREALAARYQRQQARGAGLDVNVEAKADA